MTTRSFCMRLSGSPAAQTLPFASFPFQTRRRTHEITREDPPCKQIKVNATPAWLLPIRQPFAWGEGYSDIVRVALLLLLLNANSPRSQTRRSSAFHRLV